MPQPLMLYLGGLGVQYLGGAVACLGIGKDWKPVLWGGIGVVALGVASTAMGWWGMFGPHA
jgi:hypothetical protein